jgi:hypothetical protein
MEELYKKDSRCSAGDMALALSKRFPKCQGNRKLSNGSETMSHIQMANEFLHRKRKGRAEAYATNKNTKEPFNKAAWEEFKLNAYKIAEEFSKDLAKEFKAIIYQNMGRKVPSYLTQTH